jgi:hypothetical protein
MHQPLSHVTATMEHGFAIMPMFSSLTSREIGTASNVYPHFLEPKSYRTASMDPAMTKIGSSCDIIRVQR